MSGSEPRQLPLELAHAPDYGADSFLVSPSNRAAFTLIGRWPDWPAPFVVLSGPAGSGKTHLAHIWAERAEAAIVDAGHVPAESGLAGTVVVEDVQPRGVPEREFFHLINSAKESGGSLLLTSRLPAAAWEISLPDLRSRLRMAAPAVLEPPDDDLLRQVLVKLFADRQISVDRGLVDFLLARMERSLSAAAVLVDRLDREALAEGRRITRPLAAAVLAAAAGDGFFADRQ